MKIQPELLKLKDLSSTQKLILGLILNESPLIIKLAGGYMKNCGEMGALIGVSRAKVRKELDDLVDKGWVITEYVTGWRKTNLTEKVEEFII